MNNIDYMNTSKFVDVHYLGKYTDEELKKFQELSVEEYGVKVLNILYIRIIGIYFCFLEAPTQKAVEKIIKSMVLSVIGLPKFRLLLEEARVFDNVATSRFDISSQLYFLGRKFALCILKYVRIIIWRHYFVDSIHKICI
jgi:hypothetical protein